MELVGIVIAVLAALFVFFHAWLLRHVPVWRALLWCLGTFLMLIPIFPLYFIVRPKGPDPYESGHRIG